MKIAWVTRLLLHYRIPVVEELDRLSGGGLSLFYPADYVPEAVSRKAVSVLGHRAVGMTGEIGLGAEDEFFLANRNFSVRWQPGLLAAIAAAKPDVLLCDGFFKWTLPALIHKMTHGTPIVIAYERTHHTERNAQGMRRLYRRAVVRYTDAMDCSGRLCRDYAEELGMERQRITLGHMSADTQGLSSRAGAVSEVEKQALRDRFDLKGTIFLYVGRLHERKGCRELLLAWSRAGLRDEATLVFAGDGEQREELEALIAAENLTNVRLLGRVDYDEELPALYATADTFVIATLEDNWSLVVPEAMACGLPIMTSIYNGCWPELVHPGVNGWVFDPTRPDELAAVLREGAAAQARLAEMGRASRRIVQGFGPLEAAESLYEACHIALNRRRAPVSRSQAAGTTGAALARPDSRGGGTEPRT
jgi:glycosyltransferase involved in cell wall biosynthesis